MTEMQEAAIAEINDYLDETLAPRLEELERDVQDEYDFYMEDEAYPGTTDQEQVEDILRGLRRAEQYLRQLIETLGEVLV